jgi:16S rRNA (guanine966-N2)-methyltransferase
MRIVAGAWKGRMLAAPKGDATRPTADRVRQALFDMLFHAPWGGRDLVVGAEVLDAFAGTGALGFEALSRGAAHATFFEAHPAATAAIKTNITSFRARATLHPDALKPPRGKACGLAFLDPPYFAGLLEPAAAALRRQGWLGPGTILVAETARAEDPPDLGEHLAERTHGAARISFFRLTD